MSRIHVDDLGCPEIGHQGHPAHARPIQYVPVHVSRIRIVVRIDIGQKIVVVQGVRGGGQTVLAKIGHAEGTASFLERILQCRHKQRGQHGDDGDHHQEFNQSKSFLSVPEVFHPIKILHQGIRS